MRSITETLTFQATVSYESILDIIHIGKDLCHDLRRGATPPVGARQAAEYGIRGGRVATSGAAHGSLMMACGCRVATARAAATIVAVVPTLDRRSQLS